jgi:hypothetical protein
VGERKEGDELEGEEVSDSGTIRKIRGAAEILTQLMEEAAEDASKDQLKELESLAREIAMDVLSAGRCDGNGGCELCKA